MRILIVNTTDIGGGAEKISRTLVDEYRRRGNRSWLMVGRRASAAPSVIVVPRDQLPNLWLRFWDGVRRRTRVYLHKLSGASPTLQWLKELSRPMQWIREQLGHEEFNYPGTWRLLDAFSVLPDVIQCNNLHGDFFDLRALPWLSRQVPVVLRLSDLWLFTGHCAHTLGCQRLWTGCGSCPHLDTYPAVKRDATAYNWRRKKRILERGKFYVTAPSQWIMRKALQSLIAPSIRDYRVIPNGVDLSIFRPSGREAVRKELGIPTDAVVMLFSAHRARQNAFKDLRTVEAALDLIAQRFVDLHAILIVLGDTSSQGEGSKLNVRYIPYQSDSGIVAKYYQAADIYLHAAIVDTFPNAVLEAVACGTPVVATSVGGIPEQVKCLDHSVSNGTYPAYGDDEATGLLVPPGDAVAMAAATEVLLHNDALRAKLGRNASRDARNRFDLNDQVEAYLEWYKYVIEHWRQDL